MRVLIPAADYKDACDKIREKTGTTDLIKSGELADKIEDVANAQWNEFWDNFQANGTRTNYHRAFCQEYWNDEIFKPKYDMICENTTTSAEQIFMYAGISDIKGILERNGVVIDFSKCTRLQSSFQACKSATLPDIDLSSCTYLPLSFYDASFESLVLKNLSENCTFDRAFNRMTKLTDLSIDGIIGNNGVSFIDSYYLTHESLMNIINVLKDFNETIVENYSAESFTDVEMPVSHTLVAGDKYSLTYEGDGFEPYTVEATVADIYVMGAGKNALGLEFHMPSQNEGDIPFIWIYNDNGKLMYCSYFYVPNGKITLTKVATETHTVTLGTTNLNKLSDEEKQIATKKGWSLL